MPLPLTLTRGHVARFLIEMVKMTLELFAQAEQICCPISSGSIALKGNVLTLCLVQRAVLSAFKKCHFELKMCVELWRLEKRVCSLCVSLNNCPVRVILVP